MKLKAKDGKYRMTDVVDIKGMFRIIESIPSKNAEPIKMWLAKLARRGGKIAKITRDNLKKELERKIITSKNKLNYQYIDENKKIENK